jgi:hypothetical protein
MLVPPSALRASISWVSFSLLMSFHLIKRKRVEKIEWRKAREGEEKVHLLLEWLNDGCFVVEDDQTKGIAVSQLLQ